MIKGVIFDMDGVMIDSERQSNEGWAWAAGQLGIEIPVWLVDRFKGAPAHLSCQFFDDYFQGKADYWEAKRLRTQYVMELRKREGIPVKPGLYKLLDYLRDQGIKCAVATSTRRESAENTLHTIGAWDYLDAVVYGDEVENGKPAPDIFLYAAQMLGTMPDETIVIEDSINGIQAGFAAKMYVVHVPDTIVIGSDIKNLTFMVCDTLEDVADLLEGMNRAKINRKAVVNAFKNYTADYNPADEKIRLKIDHTYRVAWLCERIAKSQGLSENDVEIAWLLGMLHDIGRFEQIRRYGTFSDAVSVDHAKFGADLLFHEGLVERYAKGYMTEDDGMLELAIRCHNMYRLPDSLNERQRLFCNILRDADKIDILRVHVDVPMEAIYNVTTEELRNSTVSAAVLESFYREETVLKSIRKTAADYVVGHISLLFELVYPESLRIAAEQGYIFQILDFQSDCAQTREQFMGIKKYVEAYIERNC